MKKITQLLTFLLITTMVVGQSVNFDGFNDYIYIKNDASLQTTSAMTVEAWIKLGALSDQLNKGIVTKVTISNYYPTHAATLKYQSY